MLHDEHIGGVGAEWNAFDLEGLDDTTAQLAKDAVFLIGADPNADGIGDFAAFDLVYAGDVGIGHDNLFEGGIVADFEGN